MPKSFFVENCYLHPRAVAFWSRNSSRVRDSTTVLIHVAMGFPSMWHSWRCHFQFAIDLSFNLRWSNRNILIRIRIRINLHVKD